MESKELEKQIYKIRGKQIMLDKDIAVLYGVQTKSLNLAVKRNMERFPPDFMFQLNPIETENLRFQFETSSWGGRRYAPIAFTEHGIAMLSGILRSPKAIQVNIAIIRAFIQLRHAVLVRKDLAGKVERLEGKINLLETDVRFIQEDLKEKKTAPEITGPRVKGFQKG